MIVIGQYLCNEYYSNTFLSNLFPPIIMPAEKERVIMIDIGKDESFLVDESYLSVNVILWWRNVMIEIGRDESIVYEFHAIDWWRWERAS